MAQSHVFPASLAEREEGWELALIDVEEEIDAHQQAYDRALRIVRAFRNADMDAWLNPDGNHDPTSAPQYQLDGNLHQRTRIHEIDLNAKIANRNFHIATAREVEQFGGTLARPSGQDQRGITLYNERESQYDHPALASTSAAFRFIDSVLVGLEKQAIDLGVLQPETAGTTAEAV
jgi:hypothetical protein